MTRPLVDQIAAAVLYEGYILYPYRPSVKNRQRWTFGGLFPREWVEQNANGDAWVMQTECLIAGSRNAALSISVRCLHLVARTVGEVAPPIPNCPLDADLAFRPVASLQIGEHLYQTWQEATEREIAVGEFDLGSLAKTRRHEFTLPASRSLEPLRDSDGMLVGVLERRQEAIEVAVEISATSIDQGLTQATVRVKNLTPTAGPSREKAQLCSLVSTHSVLGVRGGEFVSLTDPPEHLREPATRCCNVGCWPVLVGNEGDKDTILVSPIILPDYPQIAPESPGDLFDGAEIDEILTLRILTLTDDERRMAMAVDERAKSMLERTEALATDQLAGLHGAVRSLHAAPETVSHD